jgi:tetratricopeptide (TPR) repeat protein
MDKDYYSPHKIGGSILSAGIAYQDLVSLFYLIKHIEKDDFKEITFETHDDFTIIMSTHEMCVQVKNTRLTISQIRDILKFKYSNSKNESAKHVIIASSYDKKFKELLKYSKHLSNTYNRIEQEKSVIEDEFNELLRKNGLNPNNFHETVFEEISETQITEAVKFYMYQWSATRNWDIEIDNWFNKLIAKISLILRPERGSLNRREFEEIALSCPRRDHVKHDAPQSTVHFDHSKESILLMLKKDIALNKHFSEKLTLMKLYIELDRWEDALKQASEIFEYKESFMYYYLWVLYQSQNYNLLMKRCNHLIKQNVCLYYSYYYRGLVFLGRKEYSKAIDSLMNALSYDSTFDVNLRLAQLYYLTGNEASSLEHYQFCLSKEPLNAEVLVEISSLLPKNEAIVCLDQAIEINPSLIQAYFKKGKILRYFGLNEDAYEYFQKYLSHQGMNDEISNEFFKEMSLCLLSLGDDRAFNYMNNWLTDFLFNGANSKIATGETITILDNLWNQAQLIVCAKVGDDYIIRTSIREYLLIKGEESYIAIGCTPDSFLKMSADFFRTFNIKVENGYEYIPSIIKVYRSKNEFDKVIKSMRLQDHTYLNKDFYFPEGRGIGRWHYKEYISKKEAISVLIEELENAIHVQVKVGNSLITGWFKKGGEGYFKFCSKVENPPNFMEAVLVLECAESKEKANIKFSVQSIKIVKSATYPRAAYFKDIILPN